MESNDKVPKLTRKEFDEYTKKGIVFIDFFADWCMPCVMMSPILEELSEYFKGKIKFGKINVDENRDLAQKFNILSIPNFILFKDGKKAEQFIGAMPVENFSEKLKKFA